MNIYFILQIAIVEGRVADEIPAAILVAHAMLTALLIFVHLFSLVIATRLLPELEAFIKNPKLNISRPIAKGHYWPVQLVWYLSNIVGVLLFLIELVLVTFIEFYPKNLALASRVHIGSATLVVIFTLSAVSFPFIAIIFRSLSRQKTRCNELKLMKAQNLLETINHSNGTLEWTV